MRQEIPSRPPQGYTGSSILGAYEEKFKQINIAHEVIADPKVRAEYDQARGISPTPGTHRGSAKTYSTSGKSSEQANDFTSSWGFRAGEKPRTQYGYKETFTQGQEERFRGEYQTHKQTRYWYRGEEFSQPPDPQSSRKYSGSNDWAQAQRKTRQGQGSSQEYNDDTIWTTEEVSH